MKKLLLAIAVVFSLTSFTLLTSSLSAQPSLGGIVVPIEPCSLTYTQPLTANTPAYIVVRNYCNVPSSATAVFLNMKAGGSTTSGKIYLWPKGGSFPSVSQFNYDPNVTVGAPHSDQALVRLCVIGEDECHDYGTGYVAGDITVQSTTNVNFSMMVEGYIVPLPD